MAHCGSFLVGTQAGPPAYVKPSSEGVITFESGDINSFTDSSVSVAQSRIMTEQGGSVLLWSSNGDLDAGKGAKTLVSFVPPLFSCTSDFYCTVDIKGEVSGAGIATLQSLPGVPIGNANLIAPRGTVDAGAAGIRVSSSLNIAALAVANAFNVQVQGKTFGIPTNTVDVAANLSASQTAANAAQDAVQALGESRKAQRPSIVTVDVLGFGGRFR